MRFMRRLGVGMLSVLMLAGTAHASPRASFSVATGPGAGRAADISGSRVVWQDDRNGTWDIFLRDLVTGLETVVASGPGDQVAPAISGNRVVWQDDSAGTWDVRLLDLGTGVRSAVAAGAQDQVAPDIDGDRVVWQDRRSTSNWDIYSRDLSTGMLLPVMTEPSDQTDPSIAGATVAWVDHRRGNPDIHVKDLDQGCEEVIAMGPAPERSPAVTRTRIVWEDERNGTAAIWYQDFRVVDGAYELLDTAAVSASSAEQRAPAISGTRIVWSDSRSGTAQARVRDMGTGAEIDAGPAGDPQRAPAIDGVRLAWEDGRPGGAVRWSEVGAPQVALERPARGAVYLQDIEIATPEMFSTEPAVVAGTMLTLRATASDIETTVETVTFDVNGTPICTTTVAPYGCAWTLIAGSYALGVTATDAAGNQRRIVTDVIVL